MVSRPELGRAKDGTIRRRVPPALPDLVTVTVIANRESGKVELEHEFVGVLEAENILRWGLEVAAEQLRRANDLSDWLDE